MKKILALLMAVLMVVSLTACSGGKITDSRTATEAPAEKTVSRGTVSGNIYTNDFLGLTFTNPDGWYFYSDEELAALLGQTSEIMGQDLEIALEQVNGFIDMQAAATAGSASVNLVYEKNITNLDVEGYVNTVESQLTTMGYTVAGNGETKLGDVSFKTIEYGISSGDVSINQKSYIAVVDEYAVSICIALVGEGYTFQDLEACFS